MQRLYILIVQYVQGSFKIKVSELFPNGIKSHIKSLERESEDKDEDTNVLT